MVRAQEASPRTLKARLGSLAAQLPYLPRALALVWAAARGWTVAWVLLLLLQGLLPAATVTLTRRLVNSLVAAMGGGMAGLGPPLPLRFAPGGDSGLGGVLLPAALMAGVLLAGEALKGAAGWVRTAQSELVRDYTSALIQAKSAALDLAFYDSADYYDRLHRARREASYRSLALLEGLGGLGQSLVTLTAMAAILLPYGAWLPLLLLVGALPALYVVLAMSVREHRWEREATPGERRSWYYDWLLSERETAAELRLFGLAGRFTSAYRSLRRTLRTGRLRLARERALARLAAGLLALATAGAAVAWMAWQALNGLATLGDVALFYQAFSQGQSLLRSLLESAGQVYGHGLFLGDLFEFLDLSPQVVTPADPAPLPAPLREGIRFRGVTFRYPGAARPALEGFDLTIPAGRVTAVVGPNGAGKSTLVKLLCRFYDPEAGAVELDGADLRTLPLDKLRRAITVLFQEPVRYRETAADNIALGDEQAAPGRDTVVAAAQAAGAEEVIARLPRGYDTLLGRWFAGGQDLSVGEWQRLALARAFLRRAPIVVLDEPTSAMDSWAEADWLARFRAFAAGRTAIVITHRFTTAMHADVIHVMEGGRVVESGTHEALVARGGRYAESWRRQMQGD